MMIDFLNKYWWLAIILQSFLFVADHYMTVVGARLHKSYGSQHYAFQNGYELNPVFEKEVAESKWFTRKHLWGLLAGVFSLTVIHFLYTALFEFFLGSFMLLWLFIDLGHIVNILYFRDIRKPNSLSGQIKSSYWLSQRALAFRFISQAVLFSIVAISVMRSFFWGGAVMLLFQGFRHLSLANRKFPESSNTLVQEESK